jgi:NAD(P)-dependent dehydrogenase (short-subunit alcohol dehydrogenase family)
MNQSYFKDKVYLILGANGRIGYSLSKELLKLGSKLILADINIKKIIKLNKSNDHLVKKINIVKEKDIKKIIAQANKKFKKIDGIIHCAYPKTKDWGQVIEKINPKSLRINLFNHLGVSILVAKQFINYLLKKKLKEGLFSFPQLWE